MMRKNSKKKMYRREFLNLDTPREGGMGVIRYIKDEFSISDCNRTINLDFYFSVSNPNSKDLDNMEFKIDLLHEMVREYRTYIKRRIRKARKNLEGGE